MRVYINGVEEMLPDDWRLHIVQEGTRTRVTVERDGRFYTLTNALLMRDVLTTTSRPELRPPRHRAHSTGR